MEIWREPPGTELVCHTKVMGPKSVSLFHWHENYEICQPLNCNCDFLVNGVLIRAEPGDLISIAPQVIHRFLPQHPDSQIRVLQFPLRILLQSGSNTGTLKTYISHSQQEALPEVSQAVTMLMELMEQEPLVRIGGEKNMLLQSLAASLYYLLRKHFPGEQSAKARKDADLFFRAAEYVNAHFTQEDSTVEQLAKQLCVSREKLSGVFLQYAGIPLKRYINTLRINYVNQLLLEGCDVSTASYNSGFNSIRTFNNVYRAIQGMTPTEYLKARK